jgi:hypothetical protein
VHTSHVSRSPSSRTGRACPPPPLPVVVTTALVAAKSRISTTTVGPYPQRQVPLHAATAPLVATAGQRPQLSQGCFRFKGKMATRR